MGSGRRPGRGPRWRWRRNWRRRISGWCWRATIRGSLGWRRRARPGSLRLRSRWSGASRGSRLSKACPPMCPSPARWHLVAQDGHGADATTAHIAADAKRATASALALVQGIGDADALPERGLWFVTRGAQVPRTGTDGATGRRPSLGFRQGGWRGRRPSCNRGCSISTPKQRGSRRSSRTNCCSPTRRTTSRIARVRRQVAGSSGRPPARGALPCRRGRTGCLRPARGGAIEALGVQPLAPRALEPKEVRVEVEACGLKLPGTCSEPWAWSRTRGCSGRNSAAASSRPAPDASLRLRG